MGLVLYFIMLSPLRRLLHTFVILLVVGLLIFNIINIDMQKAEKISILHSNIRIQK